MCEQRNDPEAEQQTGLLAAGVSGSRCIYFSRRLLSHSFAAFLWLPLLGKVRAASCPQGLCGDSRKPEPLNRPALAFLSLMESRFSSHTSLKGGLCGPPSTSQHTPSFFLQDRISYIDSSYVFHCGSLRKAFSNHLTSADTDFSLS